MTQNLEQLKTNVALRLKSHVFRKGVEGVPMIPYEIYLFKYYKNMAQALPDDSGAEVIKTIELALQTLDDRTKDENFPVIKAALQIKLEVNHADCFSKAIDIGDSQLIEAASPHMDAEASIKYLNDKENLQKLFNSNIGEDAFPTLLAKMHETPPTNLANIKQLMFEVAIAQASASYLTALLEAYPPEDYNKTSQEKGKEKEQSTRVDYNHLINMAFESNHEKAGLIVNLIFNHAKEANKLVEKETIKDKLINLQNSPRRDAKRFYRMAADLLSNPELSVTIKELPDLTPEIIAIITHQQEDLKTLLSDSIDFITPVSVFPKEGPNNLLCLACVFNQEAATLLMEYAHFKQGVSLEEILEVGRYDPYVSKFKVCHEAREELHGILTGYHENRRAISEPYTSLFGSLAAFFGRSFSRADKLGNVNLLCKTLGYPPADEVDYRVGALNRNVLYQGSLGNKIKEWEKRNDITLHQVIAPREQAATRSPVYSVPK